MICDALICLWFLCHTVLLSLWIRRESFDGHQDLVHMTDFAVRVKNLPAVESYSELEELAAALTVHIRDVVDAEKEVFVYRKHQAPAEDIVSINFAERPFKNY
mmetsp:Transcript_20514/g.25234  ORF Transcript_20514/g.25234 Transcript_20514/m.25234 type:complete len:103 (+) Transcript_20514:1217-1525(+)